MAEGKVRVELVLDDGSVQQAFINLDKKAKDSGQKGSKSLLPISKGLLGIAAAAVAAGTAIVAAFFSRASINAAVQQEDAVNRLNQALASAGRFSEEASRSFQEFANEIQRTTKVGDETVIQLGAIAQNFARTNEEAERLTRAAIELSAATGKDLNSSLQALGQTLTGQAGTLARQVPEIRELGAEALKAGEGIDFILSRFSGTAAAQVNTFSGAVQQSKNAFGDLQEQFGFFITQSPVVVALFQELTKLFTSIGDNLGGLREGRDIVGELIILTVKFAEAVNLYLLAPLEILSNVVTAVFRTMLTGVAAVINAFAELGNFIVEEFTRQVTQVLERFASVLPGSLGNAVQGMANVIDVYQTQLGRAAELSRGVLSELAGESADAFRLENLLDVSTTGSMAMFLENLRVSLENAAALTQEYTNNQIKPDLEEVGITAMTVGESFRAFADGFNESAKSIAASAEENFKKAGAAMLQGIGTAGGQAFAAFGKAIATGEDALKSFGDALLAAIGQVAIQLGTTFILQGAAYIFAGLPNGPSLIAAGAALAAFGGVLAGLGGGPATAPAAGSPGGSPLQVEADSGVDLVEDVEDRRPDTQVSVNIQGDVLDSEDTGLRIVDVLNRAFDKQGVQVKRGAFA